MHEAPNHSPRFRVQDVYRTGMLLHAFFCFFTNTLIEIDFVFGKQQNVLLLEYALLWVII